MPNMIISLVMSTANVMYIYILNISVIYVLNKTAEVLLSVLFCFKGHIFSCTVS